MVRLTTADSLVVSEVFGPTVQGEGPSAGRRCSFVRLGGCNLHCSWCDSAYTWDAGRFDLRQELNRRPVDAIADKLATHGTSMVVVTGGEPLLHQNQGGFLRLLGLLTDQGCDIEVETNGTQAPTAETAALVTRFNVSPKLASGGDPLHLRLVPAAVRVLLATGKAVFKFVCSDLDDLAEASAMAEYLTIPPHLVWIMPEGTDAVKLNAGLAALADLAVAAGFNLTTRLHVLAWGNERAR